MRLLSRLTATAVVVGALTIAPHASADLSQGFSNADGTVNCENANIEGTYVACLSEGARATSPQCNPPGQLAPRFIYHAGRSKADCFNQGLTTTNFKRLQPGQVHQFNEVTAIADAQGGIHFVGPQGYLGYAGKKAVSGSEGLGDVSSRVM
ncbi:hypothetical protein [Corynebacterium aurimucosum]